MQLACMGLPSGKDSSAQLVARLREEAIAAQRAQAHAENENRVLREVSMASPR